jgi:pilus assembly protein Flp/PilA
MLKGLGASDVAKTIRRFLKDQTGATAIEYALLGTLIAVALAGTFAVVGNSFHTVLGVGTGGATDIIADQANNLPGN